MTGISKTTVSRINKTYAEDKENNKGGRPSKLSAADQRRIISKITTGQFDNAVQAAQFINNIISKPFNPQTIRDSLKKLISEQLSRPRNLFLQQHIGRRDFTLLKSTETILWKTGRGSFGQMRLKSIDLGQMGTSLYGKKGVSHFLTEPLFPLSSLDEEI